MSIFDFFAKKNQPKTTHIDVATDGATLNCEGAEALILTPEYALYSAAVTSTLSDNFYTTVGQNLARLCELADKVSPAFIARLAVYTRTQMNMRSMPLLLICLLAQRHSGDSLVACTVERCVLRADEIMELLTCYQLCNPGNARGPKRLGKLSNQIRLGLEAAFNRFDEYQFAKYNRRGLEVTLRDALFIVHPKPKDAAQQAIFDKIVNNTLEVPYTWEVELSKVGQAEFANANAKDAAFAGTWTELIRSGRLGYMALLRNLRNIFAYSKLIDRKDLTTVLHRIDDADEVARSRQLPFRFYSAYKELGNISSPYRTRVLHALEGAMLESAANINGVKPDDRILMACDVSGSMHFPISRNSSIFGREVGLVLAMTLRSRCPNTIIGLFGDIWKTYDIPTSNILEGINFLTRHESEVGWSTNGHLAIDWLIETHTMVDKVMMFTDCQLWRNVSNSWMAYRRINPKAHLYLFDLHGYGSVPLRMPTPGVHLIAGWSDKIFDIVAALDNGRTAIDTINALDL